MSDEHDRSSDVIRIGANPAGTPDREAMWAVISESWDAQKARRDRLRVVRSRVIVGCGIAATLLVGVFAGRWSVYNEPYVSPPVPAAARVGVSVPRQVALHEHLRDVETLLLLFEAGAGQQDGLAERARDLAAVSRMQISNSAVQSSELESLLQDLELLLIQIARVAAAGDAMELEITLAGIRDADAIARMRLLQSQAPPLDEI